MRKTGYNLASQLKLFGVLLLSFLFIPSGAQLHAESGLEARVLLESSVDEDLESSRPKRRRKRKKRQKKRRKTGAHWHNHEVVKGETPTSIAKKYDVHVKDLLRWNKLKEGRHIYVGQKLAINSAVTRSGKTRVEYVVSKGDVLAKIAKNYGTTVKELRKRNRKVLWNRRRGRWHLQPGMRLEVYATRLEGVGIPKGSPQKGRLENGQKMPKMKGVVIRNPSRSFGAWNTIAHLRQCFAKVQEKDRRFPKIMMGSISREGGGRLKPHKSHQSGLDVDIGFIPRKSQHRGRWFNAIPSGTLDVKRTWKLMQCFIDTGDVEYFFVDYPVQRKLYQYVKKYKKFSKSKLAKYFQYPRGKRRARAMIMHSRGHDDHMHIRFHNPTKRSRRHARGKR